MGILKKAKKAVKNMIKKPAPKKKIQPKGFPDCDSNPETFLRYRLKLTFLNETQSAVFDFPKNATVGDLLERVGDHFKRDPAYLTAWPDGPGSESFQNHELLTELDVEIGERRRLEIVEDTKK